MYVRGDPHQNMARNMVLIAVPQSIGSRSDLPLFYSQIGIYLEQNISFSGFPYIVVCKMVGLFHGKSHLEIEDLGLPLFQETTMQIR